MKLNIGDMFVDGRTNTRFNYVVVEVDYLGLARLNSIRKSNGKVEPVYCDWYSFKRMVNSGYTYIPAKREFVPEIEWV